MEERRICSWYIASKNSGTTREGWIKSAEEGRKVHCLDCTGFDSDCKTYEYEQATINDSKLGPDIK